MEAFKFDEFLDPVNHENLIVIVNVTYITGVKPTVGIDNCCLRLLIIKVSY